MSVLPPEFASLPRLQPPDLSTLEASGLWLVCDEWRTPAVADADGRMVQVVIRGASYLSDGRQFGFWTDGASVPLLFWTASGIEPFSMPFLCAALGHDGAYAAQLADRATCDRWMAEWAHMAGVSWYQRNIALAAVRAAGWTVWNRHAPQSIADARQVVQLVPAGAVAYWTAPLLPSTPPKGYH